MMGRDTKIFVFWMLSLKPAFSSLSHFHQEALQFLLTLCHKGGVVCISEVFDISPSSLDSSCASSSPAFYMMYSVYKLNKQGDNMQPWHIPFLIWKPVHSFMSVFNYCFLTCIQTSHGGRYGSSVFPTLRIFQFVVIHIAKGFGLVNEAEVDVFSGTFFLFLWYNECWQFDLWFLCLF